MEYNLVEETMATLAPEKITPVSAKSEPASSVDAESNASPHFAVLSHAEQAQAIVNSYVPWSAAAGLIPLPGLDVAGLLAVQLRMLNKLSKLYGVPFVESAVKTTVSSLIGTVLTANVGAVLGSLVKTVPIIGSVAGAIVAPAAYSAVTYAIGRIFVAHFESGGTFLDFDAVKMRAHFVSEYEKARAVGKSATAAV